MREAEAELAAVCGRFKSPLALDDRLREHIAKTARGMSVLEGSSFVYESSLPLAWQVLLSYLQQHDIVASTSPGIRYGYNDLPRLLTYRFEGTESISYTDGGKVAIKGQGSGVTLEETVSKAVGELLERHFLTAYRNDDLRTSSYTDLIESGERALNPSDLNLPLASQGQRAGARKKIEEAQLRWTMTTNLETDEETYVPAQLVFWNYDRAEGEPWLLQPTTSGGAGHFTREEATLSALLELIQRDGFLIYWLNSLAPKRIDPKKVSDPAVEAFLSYCERYRLQPIFLNTTTDVGVPCVTCVILDTVNEPVVAVGSAAGFDLAELILHSGDEAILTHSTTVRSDQYTLPETYMPFSDHTLRRKERLTLWRGETMMDRFRFFISGEMQNMSEFEKLFDAPLTIEGQTAHIHESLARLGAGYEIYIRDIEHEVLTTLGYSVVRAIVPQLFPLYLTESSATLDSKRLKEVPAKLGYQAAQKLNPWPHPFP